MGNYPPPLLPPPKKLKNCRFFCIFIEYYVKVELVYSSCSEQAPLNIHARSSVQKLLTTVCKLLLPGTGWSSQNLVIKHSGQVIHGWNKLVAEYSLDTPFNISKQQALFSACLTI